VHAPDEVPEGLTAHALVFDASGIADPSGLRALYDFFHPWIGTLGKSGRVVVLGRAPEHRKKVAAAAASAGLDGFVRSLAKEVGRKGATAQLVYVEPGAEDRLESVLRWVLSPRSAFVTGQPIWVTKQAKAVEHRPQTRPLHGKVALVTGAARGIGAATAERMAEEGAHVVCLDRPADDGPASQVAREIGGLGAPVDVSDPDAPRRDRGRDQGDARRRRHRRAQRRGHPRQDPGPHEARALGSGGRHQPGRGRAHHRGLLEGGLRDEGRVVCLSSVAGIAGNMGQTNYAASKPASSATCEPWRRRWPSAASRSTPSPPASSRPGSPPPSR
jgi:3-oxoacyl-[acyl-carrier protein] reductase